MVKIISCEDGVLISGADDDELIANAETHLRDVHPDLVGTVSGADLLVQAVELPGADVITHPYESAQRAVAVRVEEIFSAAREQDFDRLAGYHLAGSKFTKFDDFEPLHRQGAEEARASEEEGLGSVTNFRYRLEDLKVDVFGPAAVATFVLDSGFDVDGETIDTRARATLVMVLDGEQWRIAHEHFSAFKANP